MGHSSRLSKSHRASQAGHVCQRIQLQDDQRPPKRPPESPQPTKKRSTWRHVIKTPIHFKDYFQPWGVQSSRTVTLLYFHFTLAWALSGAIIFTSVDFLNWLFYWILKTLCLHLQFYPEYLKNSLTLRSTTYFPIGTDIFSLSEPASTSYGLHSFKYSACKIWNSLPKKIRNEPILTNFKCLLTTVSLEAMH